MDPQEDKNKQTQAPEDVRALEKEIKTDFKEGRFDAVKTLYDRIIKLDPENRLATKLMKKAGEKAKKQKTKEYVDMFKKLYKEKDVSKLAALAKEFKESDPENKQAAKWEHRAAKLQEKLTGVKAEEKPAEAEPIKIEAKKEEPLKIEIKPAQEPIKPAPAAPVAAAPEPKTPAVPAVSPPKAPAAEAEKEKGNLFTRMFGKKEEDIQKKSIIDTIVAKTDKKEKEPVKKEEVRKTETWKTETPEKEKTMTGLLTFSKVFLNFSVIFIALSAAFLYVEWIDQNNTVLSLAGISENTGGRLHTASVKLEEQKKEEEKLNKDIELYEGGYEDKTIETVDKIIAERINWPDIFNKINEVTNSVFPHNDFFKYVEYNNYSFDAQRNAIRVSGSLSDPGGRNLTKLVELEEAFKYYPKDMNDPKDTTEPYFRNFTEFTSFSKSLDTETGRYNSSFQLSFELNK